MRLVSFGRAGEERAGLHLGEAILDVGAAWPELGTEVRGILERGLLSRLSELTAAARGDPPVRALVPAAGVRLGPPVPNPSKIVCVGLNYRGHAREQDRPAPEHPILFSKAPTSLIGRGDSIRLRGNEHADPEAELAFVVAERSAEVPEGEAMGRVAGFTAFDDVTARDAQRADRQWFRGKSFDTFGPCGPWLVTPDEIPDPHALSISLQVNGEVRQRASTAELIFSIPCLLSYISRSMTLLPGDIVATGTPAGVGVFRDPPLFLEAGDEVEVTIEGIGTLRNPVAP